MPNVANAYANAAIITPGPAPSGDTTGNTDSNAIRALAASMAGSGAPGSGGIMQLKQGVYYINKSLLLYSGLEYWGCGQAPVSNPPTPGTRIVAAAGMTQDMVVPSGTPCSGAGMRYLTLDGGNGTNSTVLVQPAFNGINYNVLTSRCVLDCVTILNIPGDGVVTAPGNSYSGAVYRCLKILNCYGHGMNLQGSDHQPTQCEVYVSGLSNFFFQGITIQATQLKSNYTGARGVVGETAGINLQGSSCTIDGSSYCQNDVGSFQSPQTFTATNATPCVFTSAGAGFGNGTALTLSGGSLPAGFTAGTVYWVVAAAGATYELAATPGGAAIASTSTGSGTATPCNGNSVYISGNRNVVRMTCAGSSGSLLVLDANASYNMIDLQCNNQQNTTNPQYVYQINSGSVKNNRVRIVGNPTVLSAYALLTNGGTEQNNDWQNEAENYGAVNLPFAATVTPDPYQGSYVQIAPNISGAITINNPANGHAGSRLIIRLLQNGTGGNAVTFGGNYKTSAAIPTTASTATEIMFVCDATGGTWREVARATA